MHIRKAAVRLIAAILTVSALAVPSFAAQGTVSVGTSTLNVRAAGTTASAVLGQLKTGDTVEILGVTEGKWYKISLGNNATGFVSGEYVTVAADQAASIPAVVEPFYVKINVAVQNIRTGPSTDYALAGALTNGTVVKVNEVVNGWYHLDNGYISPDYSVKCDAPAAAAVASVTGSGKGAEVANYAMQFLGCPYVYGGMSPSGFDCSGFTSYMYAHFGVTLNRCSGDQLDNGTPVTAAQLQPGDLLIWNKGGYGRATHVGMYIGNGKFIHAANSSTGVIISSLSEPYYASGLVGCRRIFN